MLLPGFAGTTLPDWVAARLRGGLGGVCLFAGNVASGAQLRGLTDAIRAANPDAIIAIDEEGGDVTRLHFAGGSPYPGNAILGRLDDERLSESVGAAVGRELRAAGVNLNFAPDVDVNSNPDNPVIGVRSFGDDPDRVARHAAAWIRGHQGAGVAVTAKHFPGHGDTAQDSHHSLPVVDLPLDALRSRELVPFAQAIAAGAQAVMTSHVLLPQVDPAAPATFSRVILDELLRGELGFGGVVVTDALDMAGASAATGIPEAAVRAVIAGCDLLCIGTDNTDAQLESIENALDDAVASGRLPAERLADAGQRVTALARSLALAAEALPVTAGPEPRFDLAATAAAFEMKPGTSLAAGRTVVVLETPVNLAVGDVPWGPPHAARLSEGEPLPVVSGQLVLVGRDNHRWGWVRDIIDRARSEHPSVVVVDMGWPGDGRAYADLCTFGASRHVGLALEARFEGTA